MRSWSKKWRARLGRLRQASWSDRRLFLETLFWLALAWLALATLPFSQVTARLGRFGEETPLADDPARVFEIQRIAYVIRIAVRHAPWSGNCMTQALAAHVLLRRRRIASTLYLGLAGEREPPRAHAWLRAGAQSVTGALGRERLTKLAAYAWSDSRRRATGDAVPADRRGAP